MSRVKGKLYFEKAELRTYMLDFVKNLEEEGVSKSDIEKRVSRHYTNTIIKKYSKPEQDRMWDEVYNTIMNIPGGYWQIVDNMAFLPEFSHYRFKCLKSVYSNTYKEKGSIKK